jgi:hypothetical protein
MNQPYTLALRRRLSLAMEPKSLSAFLGLRNK